MKKRMILPIVLAALLVLFMSSCHRTDLVKDFLEYHYTVSYEWAEEYTQFDDHTDMLRQRYLDQPISDQCFEEIMRRAMLLRLARIAIDNHAEVKVASVETQLISESEALISYNYTVILQSADFQQKILGSLSVIKGTDQRINYIHEHT